MMDIGHEQPHPYIRSTTYVEDKGLFGRVLSVWEAIGWNWDIRGLCGGRYPATIHTKIQRLIIVSQSTAHSPSCPLTYSGLQKLDGTCDSWKQWHRGSSDLSQMALLVILYYSI